MAFVEFAKGDTIEPSIRVTQVQEGGLGRVYFGYCRNRQIRVVVKTLRRELWEEHRLAEKWTKIERALVDDTLPGQAIDIGQYLYFTFFREARLTCQSRNHPNVVKGTRFWWTQEGQPFLECEYVENSRDLKALAVGVAGASASRRLGFLQTAHIAVSVCNGMIYIADEMLAAYNRTHPDNPAVAFVHRDITPRNVLIDERNMVKIIDLGLAKYYLRETPTQFVGMPLAAGTFPYTSPEQKLNYEAVMPASDVFSLGITLYQLLGGDAAAVHYRSEPDPIPNIPAGLHDILATCLKQDMSKRYPGFRELKAALRDWIAQVKDGRIRVAENRRCERCGYISPDPQPEAASAGPPGHQLVAVPAGPFCQGCRDDHKATLARKLGSSDALRDDPYREVALDAFEIDRYPVTNAQYHRFVEETGHAPPSHWRSGKDSDPFPGSQANVPVVNVSHNDALAYCKWAGLRLPAGPEWEKAARGTDGRLYPWGDSYNSPYCNSAESRRGGPVAVDLYPEGASPYGCEQMVGNVFEWVDEPYPKNSDYRYLRGGSWAVSCEILGPPFFHYIAAPRNHTRASSQGDIFGFRCARDGRGETAARNGSPSGGKREQRCPLCGGGFVSFRTGEIKVPEKNIYSWVGYFDIG